MGYESIGASCQVPSDYGFCAAITKPFDLEELKNAIESVLS